MIHNAILQSNLFHVRSITFKVVSKVEVGDHVFIQGFGSTNSKRYKIKEIVDGIATANYHPRTIGEIAHDKQKHKEGHLQWN